jgi:acyl carrier protein
LPAGAAKEELLVSSRHVQDAIVRAIKIVAPASGDIEAATKLLGENASLDSLAFVTFLVTLEAQLDNQVDLSDAFVMQAPTETDNPFESVGSLTAYIDGKLHGDR